MGNLGDILRGLEKSGKIKEIEANDVDKLEEKLNEILLEMPIMTIISRQFFSFLDVNLFVHMIRDFINSLKTVVAMPVSRKLFKILLLHR